MYMCRETNLRWHKTHELKHAIPHQRVKMVCHILRMLPVDLFCEQRSPFQHPHSFKHSLASNQHMIHAILLTIISLILEMLLFNHSLWCALSWSWAFHTSKLLTNIPTTLLIARAQPILPHCFSIFCYTFIKKQHPGLLRALLQSVTTELHGHLVCVNDSLQCAYWQVGGPSRVSLNDPTDCTNVHQSQFRNQNDTWSHHNSTKLSQYLNHMRRIMFPTFQLNQKSLLGHFARFHPSHLTKPNPFAWHKCTWRMFFN